MKICGIIAEYNPFHAGHAYQIKKARELSGADFVIVAMSGHFVQRGEPAIFDPYTRAKMALKGGADAVYMMPSWACKGGADDFAFAGVGILDGLGCDYISFGIEDTNPDELNNIAEKYLNESEAVKERIVKELKSGKTYAAAIASAYGVRHLKPNDLLAVSYIKAMKLIDSEMGVIPVERIGHGYDDKELSGKYPSALAIREAIKTGEKKAPRGTYPMYADDFLNRIIANLQLIEGGTYLYESFDEMVKANKHKNDTYTSVARHYMNLATLSDNEEEDRIYAKLLGFKEGSSKVLKEIKKRSQIPVVTKPADDKNLVGSEAFIQDIYNQEVWNKYRKELPGYHSSQIIVI